MFTIDAANFGPLRRASWSPRGGLNLVVGPNQSGKSTLLMLPELLGQALSGSLGRAVDHHLGGGAQLRHHDAGPTEPVSVAITHGAAKWTVLFETEGGAVLDRAPERIELGSRLIASRSRGSTSATFKEAGLVCGDQLALRVLSETLTGTDRDEHADVIALRSLLDGYRRYVTHNFAFNDIQTLGSQHSRDRYLHASGQNVFSVLANWKLKRADKERYDFVMETLQRAFTGFEDLDFETAGTIVTAKSLYSRDRVVPMKKESTGFLVLLLQLTAVASGAGCVAIDEPENGLHPAVIRLAMESIAERAQTADVAVCLATHSPVAIDHLGATPERLSVICPHAPQGPTAATDLYTREYLNQFRLGLLFADGDLGSPT